MKNFVHAGVNNAFASWRTTLAGVVAMLAIVMPEIQMYFDGNAATNPDWNVIVAAVMVFLGFSTARDNSVTSRQAGAES